MDGERFTLDEFKDALNLSNRDSVYLTILHHLESEVTVLALEVVELADQVTLARHGSGLRRRMLGVRPSRMRREEHLTAH